MVLKFRYAWIALKFYRQQEMHLESTGLRLGNAASLTQHKFQTVLQITTKI